MINSERNIGIITTFYSLILIYKQFMKDHSISLPDAFCRKNMPKNILFGAQKHANYLKFKHI
jgi:hypothetical protein